MIKLANIIPTDKYAKLSEKITKLDDNMRKLYSDCYKWTFEEREIKSKQYDELYEKRVLLLQQAYKEFYRMLDGKYIRIEFTRGHKCPRYLYIKNVKFKKTNYTGGMWADYDVVSFYDKNKTNFLGYTGDCEDIYTYFVLARKKRVELLRYSMIYENCLSVSIITKKEYHAARAKALTPKQFDKFCGAIKQWPYFFNRRTISEDEIKLAVSRITKRKIL